VKNDRTPETTPVGQNAYHESAYRHVTGEARYVDDLAAPPEVLVAHLVTSPIAHGRILSLDVSDAASLDGIHAVLTVADVPGDPLIGPAVHDEPILASEMVHYIGQPVALVVGENYDVCREAARRVVVDYEPLPSILTIEDARANDAFLTEPHVIARGDLEDAFADSDVVVEAAYTNGAQNHFYLETQAALALPVEGGGIHVFSSTQHPTEIQKLVGLVLGLDRNKVVCEVPRMGGAFGGKESQASSFACYAALGVHHTGRPVKVWLNRDQDMSITGHRHPFSSRYKAGFDGEGRLKALEVELFSDGGWSLDLSHAIMDRALFHLDNAYYIPALKFVGRVCRTNLPSNTAFRGFGGPQGMLVVEDAINRFAERMGMDPAEVRRRNFYGPAPRNRAPYGQEITDNHIARLTETLLTDADYDARRVQIDAFNAANHHMIRGIGFQPVKFGISFTMSMLNQAGALVLVYTDGTVQLNHGGTEMGQGLHTKMLAVAAHELGVLVSDIRVMNTATDKVPNTSATAASSGSDLNGQAVLIAAREIRERMRPQAAEMLDTSDLEAIVFQGGRVFVPGYEHHGISFADLANACWFNQISLASTGYYRTPGISYDHATGQGTPFHYFAYGGAVVEVEVSTFTGEYRVKRVDIIHDVGDSLVPSIDVGQVEGGFIQGLGWLSMEEVLFDATGRSITVGPSTYKIPAMGDTPMDFRVALLERAKQPGVIHGSKAVGEPPLMLAIGVLTALRHAIASCGAANTEVSLEPPCTPEAVLRAVLRQRQI
jgi:xanthine dehydrogenase large subunit